MEEWGLYPFLKSPKNLLRQSERVEIRGGKTKGL